MGWGGGTVSLIFILTNPFQLHPSLSGGVFCVFTTYLSVLLLFHGENLVLLNLIN